MNIKSKFVAIIAASSLILGASTAAQAAPSPAPSERVTKGIYAPKGFPSEPKLSRSGPTTAFMLSGPAYRYAGGRQASITAEGVSANVRIAKPFLSTAEYHSLGEIAAIKNIGGFRQIVEVGWNVDRVVNGGSTEPHLFVYHWVNDTTSCYNGCGWVDYNGGGLDAGASMASLVGTAVKMAIQYSDGKWWITVNEKKIGYFPESIWATAGVTGFNNMSETQLFGEVVVEDGVSECSDMGTGQFASSSSAAYFASTAYINGPASANLATFATSSARWSAQLASGSTRTFYYGGPGGNSSNATPGNVGSC